MTNKFASNFRQINQSALTINILKYLNLIKSILCISEISETQELSGIPQSLLLFSSFYEINKKTQLRQILRYITPVANF